MTGTTEVPKLTERTWLGQRGESGATSMSTGRRVHVMRWLEDGPQGKEGEASVRAIDGDGRSPDFRVIHEVKLTSGHTEEDLVWACDRCACALIADRQEARAR